MPELDWPAFARLPGAATRNWELLCRGLIERNYRRYGRLRSLRQQPGVEFHLPLELECSLGSPPAWWGWQCRWYELPKDKSLGNTRRAEILAAIQTTERNLPGLTDWVLWLRELPRKADVDWFFGLTSKMRLRLWDESHVENHLCVEAAVLRSTYFGELVLTPEQLEICHERAVEPIRKRWDPLVHVRVDVERELRRALAEPGAWQEMRDLESRLRRRVTELDELAHTIGGEEERSLVANLSADLREVAQQLAEVADCCDTGRPHQVIDACESVPTRFISPRDLHKLSVRLRTLRSPASLIVAAADADLVDARLHLRNARRLAEAPLFAVIGNAGQGKTFLSAQITAQTSQRAAGVFILGADLTSEGSLDDLARRVPGLTVQTFDELLEAVDAAGGRAGRRLPIVVDGLNEAQNPRVWRTLLAQVVPILPRFPNVLLVVTLRASVESDALVGDAVRLTLHGFEYHLNEAVGRYFKHYLIDPGEAWLPWRAFHDPLFLRMFCEATNPDRSRPVGVEALPTSLTAVFERYRDTAADRIRQRLKLPPKYVADALERIATALWVQTARALPSEELANLVGDDPREWDRSLMRALEEEGVLWRQARPDSPDQRSAVLFDAFAGFLIADAMVRSVPRDSVGSFPGPDIWLRMASDSAQAHPLAEDILRGLVGVLPRRQGRQLWKAAPPAFRDSVLAQAADLEAQYLDPETVNALAELISRPPSRRGFLGRDLLDRLMEVRDGTVHPLNAEFVDRVLRTMASGSRDVRWTEWVRARAKQHQVDLATAERRWIAQTQRDHRDYLNARWIAWLLTSTIRGLRDRATRALYWYGRGDAATLFDLTLQMLGLNDPYVPERMAAASYGVVMALHADPAEVRFREESLPDYARRLFSAMFDARAPHATTHALLRDFARRTIEVALKHHPSLLKTSQRRRIASPFRHRGIRGWGSRDESEHARSPFHMDFANYTIGTLLPDRQNYDFGHREYQGVRDQILWRVFDLGWTPEGLGEIDQGIGRSFGSHEENASRIDRYGKKYSWIAYYEMYGLRHDQGLLKSRWGGERDRPSDIDIDPSFPARPRKMQVATQDFLGDRSIPFEQWLREGGIPDVSTYLVMGTVDGQRGPWVLLDGYVNQEDEKARRRRFMFLRAFLVPLTHADEFQQLLEAQDLGGRWLPEVPSLHYTFAGEIPWCDTFAANGLARFEFDKGWRTRRISKQRFVFTREDAQVDDDELRAVLRTVTVEGQRQNPNASLDALRAGGISVHVVKERVPVRERLTKKLTALIPVVQHGWESYHSEVNPASNAVVLARELAEAFGLWVRLPSWDMADPKGDLACLTTDWGEAWKNRLVSEKCPVA